jgi:hypothetical protein
MRSAPLSPTAPSSPALALMIGLSQRKTYLHYAERVQAHSPLSGGLANDFSFPQGVESRLPKGPASGIYSAFNQSPRGIVAKSDMWVGIDPKRAYGKLL